MRRESVPGASSQFTVRSRFVSQCILHAVLSGVVSVIRAQTAATGGSMPVRSGHFGLGHATDSTQDAMPNQALQRTAPRVTVAALSGSGVVRAGHLLS